MVTAEAPAEPPAQPGEIVGGRYRLESILGQGGMGTVWRARHLELDVEVAVKLIPPQQLSSPVALTRFKREARAAAAIKSPHVVTVHDYGDGDGRPYLVMELLPGEDLRARLDRVGRLPLEAATTLFDAMCKALRVAHEAGIVHRDLKPGNVFLARSGEEEIVKVLDFGIAKELHATADTVKTASDALVGSPRYMSPEQVRGSHVDARSDLWSASVVLYEMVVGRHPFSGDTVGDVLLKIAMDEIAKPSSIVPALSPAIDAFFARALERIVERRFPDAATLAAAFREAVRSPIHASGAMDAPIGREDVTADLPTSRDGKPSSSPAISPRFVPVAPPTSHPLTPAADAPISAGLAMATSRGGPEADATAPALTRRIVGPPGSSRRWIVGGVVGFGLATSIAAFTWNPSRDEAGAVASSAGDAPSAASAAPPPPQAETPTPTSTSTPTSSAARVAPSPPAAAVASSAPSAPVPATPARTGRLPPARPSGASTQAAPSPRKLDAMFGVEEDP